MATWIHFTKDVFRFAESRFLTTVEKTTPEMFSDEGLFVYRFTDDFPVAERSAAWGGRDAVYIKCDEALVEFVQSDPLGDDPTQDEYLIPLAAFGRCEIWFE